MPARSGPKKNDSRQVKVKSLLVVGRQRLGYERELVAAQQACQ
ncbi:hypothetical protein [Pseudomonas sp. DY-1]|nr:hypothetical protein [Pseudomonas sp. DY-1]